MFLYPLPPPSGPLGLTPLPWWHPAALVATAGGVGHLRPAPGTWGSLAALLPAWLIVAEMGPVTLAVMALVVAAIGAWASGIYVYRTGTDDPSTIVVDEVAGQWLTLVALPLDPFAYALGFLLFRIFDVLKPWPVSWADRRLKGGLGVVCDDVLAGVMAGIAVWVLWAMLEG